MSFKTPIREWKRQSGKNIGENPNGNFARQRILILTNVPTFACAKVGA